MNVEAKESVYHAKLFCRNRELNSGFYTKKEMTDYLNVFPEETSSYLSWRIYGEATKVYTIRNRRWETAFMSCFLLTWEAVMTKNMASPKM